MLLFVCNHIVPRLVDVVYPAESTDFSMKIAGLKADLHSVYVSHSLQVQDDVQHIHYTITDERYPKCLKSRRAIFNITSIHLYLIVNNETLFIWKKGGSCTEHDPLQLTAKQLAQRFHHPKA